MTDKNYKIAAVLMLVAAICFGIAAYCHFFCGKVFLGILSSVAALTDLISGIIDHNRYKRSETDKLYPQKELLK